MTKTITLTRNAEYSKSRWRGSGVYELHARESQSVFIVDVAGRMAAKVGSLDMLHAGDTLQVQFLQGQETALANPSKEIRIYGLQQTGGVHFDVAGYNAADRKYGSKLAWVSWISGILLLLNGLTLLKDKTAIILAGVGLAVWIVLRVTGFLV